MYKKLMVTLLAVMVVGVAQDCHAARKARAQSIRLCVKRAAQFDGEQEAVDALWNQRRARAPHKKIVRAAAASQKRAEHSQLVKAMDEKNAFIDAIRKNLDKQNPR